jgi:predicted site-specific integrase-resolvase
MNTDDNGSDHRMDPVIAFRRWCHDANMSPDTVKRRNKAGLIKLVRLSANRYGIRHSEGERYLKTLEV